MNFSALEASSGGSSNTPHKSTANPTSTLCKPILDYCTAVFPAGSLKKLGLHTWPEFVCTVFALGPEVAMSAIQDRRWNFYPYSATLVDVTGSNCGKVGFSDDGRVCISLSGQGTQHVRNWALVRRQLEDLGAHLTRLDIAVDDLASQAFTPESMRQAYHDGAFNNGGRNPHIRFVSDEGTGKGSTLYIGQKGYKELCVYEKGKQLGDPDSKHVRCELRLYAKHHVLSLEALTDPLRYFRGAYELLADFVEGELSKLDAKDAVVNATVKGMERFLNTQAGTALGLVFQALGEDATAYLLQHIARPGRPGRFKNVTGDLVSLVRSQLSGESHAAQQAS